MILSKNYNFCIVFLSSYLPNKTFHHIGFKMQLKNLTYYLLKTHCIRLSELGKILFNLVQYIFGDGHTCPNRY